MKTETCNPAEAVIVNCSAKCSVHIFRTLFLNHIKDESDHGYC